MREIFKGKITENGSKYWFKLTEHFDLRLNDRFGKKEAKKIKQTLSKLEAEEYNFGDDKEELVVRDFSNDTVVVYSESLESIKGSKEIIINLITSYTGENGAEKYQQAPYSRVVVFNEKG